MQLINGLVGQFQFGGSEVLSQMCERGRTWNEKDIGRTMKQPGERDLHRRRLQSHCHCVNHRRL